MCKATERHDILAANERDFTVSIEAKDDKRRIQAINTCTLLIYSAKTNQFVYRPRGAL